MSILLTTDQWASIVQAPGLPVHVSDPSQSQDFVLVKADVYARFKSLFEADSVTEQERLFQLEQFGRRAGWDDPAMDIYDDLDPRRQT